MGWERILIITLVFIPLNVICQEIPKFANTIIVEGTCFDSLKNSLLDNGYFIDQQNKDDGTVITKAKGIDKYDMHTLIMYIRIKDSVAKITGKWNLNVNYNAQKGGLYSNDKTDFMPLEYWKDKHSNPHVIFVVMDNFAKSLHGKISYVKQ